MYDNAISEQQLLLKVAAGDERAYRQLFHLHWDNIYNVALALTKSVELAEDMVQDIFLKIWQKRTQFVGIERFEDYLFIMGKKPYLYRIEKEIPGRYLPGPDQRLL